MEVIDAARRARAAQIAHATMGTLRDRSRLATAGEWSAHSMLRGDTGLAITCSAFAELWPDEGWDACGHAFLKAALGTAAAPQSISLFHSVAGVTFALRCLSRSGQRYVGVLEQVEAMLFARIGVALDKLPPAGGLAEADFDLIDGLSGAAVPLTVAAEDSRHLAGRTSTPSTHSTLAISLLERIMRRFTVWALQPVPGGFWTPPDRIRDPYPEARSGYLNLGVAHGIAGPLALACLIKRAALLNFDLTPLITTLAERLNACILETSGGPDIPYHYLAHVAPSLERQTRSAWCYGNPGAARALQLAALACDRPAWEDTAAEILHASLGRSEDVRAIPSPTFCHGKAGLVHVLHRFVRDASKPRRLLHKALEQELDELLDKYDPEADFGYRDIHLRIGPRDHPGFLEGAAGIAAVLAAFAADKPLTWERAVLMG